jgi:alpha-amylase
LAGTAAADQRRISLALIFHNHQPVGNFGWVFEDVFRLAYEPMVAALERHPTIKAGLHYSGPLLEWIDANQPTFLDRLRTLVEREQVEILGGAMYEPILVALPERDRHGQLERMREDVARRFGRAPIGAWLAERVWEPSLPRDLVDAGYRYTVLDDNHLRGASVKEDAMWGTYTTDDQGRLLTVLATEKGLRYRIPWRPVEELIDYLRDAATEDETRVGVMGDDGEKMGAWPGTYELCWGKGKWVEDCFSAIERESAWLSTVTPAQWLGAQPPIGRIYVPTSSYVEMTEWALPPDEAPTFHQLLDEAVETDSPAARFLRGAMWRNFQARYREINEMHKQMLRASEAVGAMAPGRARTLAIEHLYRGQSNDCYWHGLFGGIYLVHMRMATLAELIAAEDIALGKRAAHGTADYDLDGLDEVLVGTFGQTVLVDPSEGGAISAWDLRATRSALASVMRRRPEAYHEQLRAGSGRATKLSKVLVYDRDERRSGLVRLFVGGEEQGDWARAAWSVVQAVETDVSLTRSEGGLRIGKSIRLGGDRLAPTLTLRLEIAAAKRAVDAELALEWNLNLQGGGANPQAYYRWGKREVRHDGRGKVAARGPALSFGNSWMDVDVTVAARPAAAGEWYPVETVSQSEGGFERVYQGSCLTFRWPLQLAVGETAAFEVRLSASQKRDRRVA